jgi:hypothetical protein
LKIDLTNVASGPAEFLKAFVERRGAEVSSRSTFRIEHQRADASRPLELLCVRNKRPRRY